MRLLDDVELRGMLTADLLDIGIHLEEVPYEDCNWTELWAFVAYSQPRHRIFSKVHTSCEDWQGAMMWTSPMMTNQLLSAILHSSLVSLWAKGGGKGAKPKPIETPFSGKNTSGRTVKGRVMSGTDLMKALYPGMEVE